MPEVKNLNRLIKVVKVKMVIFRILWKIVYFVIIVPLEPNKSLLTKFFEQFHLKLVLNISRSDQIPV